MLKPNLINKLKKNTSTMSVTECGKTQAWVLTRLELLQASPRRTTRSPAPYTHLPLPTLRSG